MNHEELLARFMELLAEDKLGTRSKWALETGVNAADAESVSGVLTIEVPPKVKDRLEVSFTTGECDVVTRWGGR